MTGETHLATLLSQLHPELDNEVYTFVTLEQGASLPEMDNVKGFFRENEGVTLIVPESLASRYNWQSSGQLACITCNVHSSLEAVGMTAAISAALTAVGISANVVAAYYHDHLFIPADKAEEALSALTALSQQSFTKS